MMKCVLPPPPAHTVTLRAGSMLTIDALATANPEVVQLIADAEYEVSPAGVSAKKPAPTVSMMVRLYAIAVAPTGIRSCASMAPARLRPSFTDTRRLLPPARGPSPCRLSYTRCGVIACSAPDES